MTEKPAAITFFADSPDPGPDCLCSLCGQAILENPVIRLWPLTEERVPLNEARFHEGCYQIFQTQPTVEQT